MNLSELINEIVSDWAYRVNDGMPNPKNPIHVKELEIVLNEMGLGHVKSEILQSLNEAEEGGFTNPALNKKVRYKNDKGEDKEGIVGNLLRQPEDSPGRKAAEAALPPEGSPERETMNQELGSEKDGKAKPPEDAKGKEGEDGKEGGAEAEDEKKKKAAAMFDPKADPAMGARLDREKAANDKLAQKDKDATPPWVEDPESVKAKMANVSKEKAAALEKGYNDSTHAMSDRQLDASAQKAQQKYDDALKKGDDKGADAARLELTQHKIEKNRRSNPSAEEKDNDFGFKDLKADYEKKHGEPYEADIEYPFTDYDDTKGKRASADRTPSGWMGDGPKEPEAGPEAGPNAEPPANEPSKPDTTPPSDTDVPDANSPNDTEVPVREKIKKNKVDTQNAQNRLKALERMRKDHPEQFATPEKKAEWAKNKEILASKKQELVDLESQQKFDAEKKKKAAEPIATQLKGRKSKDGEDLDVETTDNGSMIIGVEHGEGNESTKKTIESIQQLPKDTKVMFVGEGGMSKDDNGNLELSGEQAEIRDAVKGHFDNAEEGSWDENANVLDDSSPVYDEVAKSVGGSKSKAKAAIWSNMYGQDGPDENMKPDDYLDDEGKAWLVDQAQKGGVTSITKDTDFNNLSDEQKDDLYQLNYRDDDGYGETEISKAQQEYNGFRQKELDRKVKEAEDKGFTVIAPVGNSHVDMWRQRNKSKQKPEETPTDTKPEDKPEETPKEEPKADETPKATKDDIKKEKPGKEAKTDSGGSLYSVGGGYYSDKPNGPAKYVRTESVIEMAFDNSLNEDVFALFEKSITGTLQNGEKITVQELPPRAVKKATQRAKAAAATSKEEPAQQPTTSTEKPAEQPAAKKTDGTDVPGKFTPIETPPPKNEKGVEKDGKIAGTTIETEPALQNIDPEFLKQKSTEMNKYYDHFKEDKKKAEGIAREKMGYDEEQAKGLKGDEKAAYEAEVKKNQEPTYNLCKVSLPNSNLFCSGNKGIPRAKMPQFKGEPVEGSQAWDVLQKAKETNPNETEANGEPYFRQMLADKGVKVTDAEVPSESLKATQTELVGDKVLGMKSVLDAGPSHPAYKKMTSPLYVSKDGYVVDGHHRWAAITAYNMEHPDKPLPLKAMIIDQDIDQAIETSNDFANEFGVAAKSGKQTGADTQKSEPQQPTSAPNGKTNNVAKKAIDRIKDGVKKFKENETEFFVKKVHKGNSPERRTFGEAFKHKAKGAWEAIKHGAEHEVHLFKSAGSGVKNFFSGGKVSDEEKKALIGVAKKVAIAAAFGAAGGGLAHGALAFGKHVMMEFIPHVVVETVALGAGKAALFAGAEDDDTDMMKFMEIISKKLQSADIPNEVMADAVESYNQNKEGKNTNEMRIESLIKEIISEINLEAKGKKPGESKDYPGYYHRGRGYYSKQPDGEITHKSEKGKTKLSVLSNDEKEKANKNAGISNTPQNKTVAGAGLFGKDYKDARGDGEKKVTKKSNTKVNYDDRVDGETSSKVEQTYNTDTKFSEPGMAHKDRVKRLKEMKSTEINYVKIDDVYTAMGVKEGATKFPAKYMSVLTNALNFAKGKFTITDLTDAAGAGTLDSTLGELTTLMGATIQDPAKRKEFFDYLREQVKKGENKSALTIAWVNSAEDSCEAFHRKLKKDCPGGHEVQTNFWDIPSEAKAAGVKNYKKDKGKSTDINTMVDCIAKDGTRTQKWLQPSLKKNKKVNGFNSTTGRVFATTVLRWANPQVKAQYSALGNELDSYDGLDDNAPAGEYTITDKKGNVRPMAIKERKSQLNRMMRDIEKDFEDKIPSEANPTLAGERQAKLHDEMENDTKVVAERNEFLTKYLAMKPAERKKVCAQIGKDLNQKGDKYAMELMETLDTLAEYDLTTAENFDSVLNEMGITNKKDRRKLNVALMGGIISTAGNKTKSAEYKKTITKNSHDHSKAVLEYLISDNDNKKALLENISTQFPLKDLMEGKEWAILGEKGGGINLDRDTITKCLGADKFDDVVEKLVIVNYNGEPTLAYAADNGKRTIPIGVLNCRPDGIMYGSTWKLELSIHEGFADCCKGHDK